MKSLSLIMAAIAVSFSITSFSQSVKDPKAQEILKGVSAKYKSLKSFSADFKIVTLDQKDKTTDSQEGKLLVKGNKFRLSLQGQEVISDGKTSWTYLKESGEVQINDVTEEEGSISPTNIFTIYEKGFSSKYTGEKNTGNETVQQIELVPDDAKKSFFKIQISVNKKDRMLSAAKIFNKNGTHYTYQITKFVPDAPASDQDFTFDKSKYPGVEVVDLR